MSDGPQGDRWPAAAGSCAVQLSQLSQIEKTHASPRDPKADHSAGSRRVNHAAKARVTQPDAGTPTEIAAAVAVPWVC